VLALAPVAWLVLQAITTFYSIFDGRYAIFGVALAATVWGLLLPIRPVAWAATAVAVTALALVLVHYDEKPSGVNALGGPAPTSVWDMSRAQVLGRFLHPGEREVVAALEQKARKGDTVALGIRREDASYPYFGSRLDRRVVFVSASNLRRAQARWIVTAPKQNDSLLATLDAQDWTRVVDQRGWRLYFHP